MTLIIRRVVLFASRFRRINPGDYLLDESRNYLTDESGNRLVG